MLMGQDAIKRQGFNSGSDSDSDLSFSKSYFDS